MTEEKAMEFAVKKVNAIPWVSGSNAEFYADHIMSKGIRSIDPKKGFNMTEGMVNYLIGYCEGIYEMKVKR